MVVIRGERVFLLEQSLLGPTEAPSVASLGRRSVVSAQWGVTQGDYHGDHGWVMGGYRFIIRVEYGENTGRIRIKYGLKITHDFFWVDLF